MLTLAILSVLLLCVSAQAPIIDLGYVKLQGSQNLTAGINYYYGKIRLAISAGENLFPSNAVTRTTAA